MISRAQASYAFIQRFVQWLLHQEGHLKERVFRGSIWLFIGMGCTRLAGIVKLAILARLLTPADFGLIGISTLLIRWFEQFSQTGFRQALVKTSGDIEPYLNTLWTIQVLRGVALSATLFFTAPIAAWFFDHPGAQDVIQALAPIVLLRGLTNPAVVYMSRELDFQRLVTWNLSQVIAGLIVAIPLAFIYQNVWALVFSLLIGQTVHTIVSYRVHPFRPHWALDRTRVRDMAAFGKWIFWKNLLNALLVSLDGLVVGRLLGAPALGFYQVALRVATLPSYAMIEIIPRVTFPAYAQLQHRSQWHRAYLQVLEFTLLVALPVVAMICVFPHTIVQLFLGSQWLTTVPLIQLLALYGGIRTLLDIARPMLEGMGRPDLQVKLQCVEVPFALFIVWPMTHWWGLTGAALAMVSVNLAVVGIQFVMLHHILGLSLKEGLSAFRLGGLATLPLLAYGFIQFISELPGGVLVGSGSLAILLSLVLVGYQLQLQLKRFQTQKARS